MSTKHTPGPWEVDAHGWPIIVNGPERTYKANEVDANVVAIVESRDGLPYRLEGYHYDKKTAAANARLIAAAPDLLTASRDFLAWFRVFVDPAPYTEINCRELTALQAAIAKADRIFSHPSPEEVEEMLKGRKGP